MKNIKNLFTLFLSLLLIAGLTGCSNLLADKSEKPLEKTIEPGKTYIAINTQELSISRTIYPASNINILSNFVLKGKKASDTGDAPELATAANLSELNAVVVEISEAGSWEFTLQGDAIIGGYTIPFSDTEIVTIAANKLNTLSFKLRAPDDNDRGGLKASVTFSPAESVTSIVAVLYDEDKTTEINTKTIPAENFEDAATGKKATYTLDMTDLSERLPSGTYYLTFKFMCDGLPEPLATLSNFVRVIGCLESTANYTIKLNPVYDVSYSYWEGTAAFLDSELTNLSVAGGATLPTKCSRRTQYTLPALSLPGHTFIGWFADSSCTEPITQISKGTSSNITLNAQFEAAGGSGPSLDGFVSVPGNGSVPNMLVGKKLITEAEYEQYMVYHADVIGDSYTGAKYKPSTAAEDKSTTPVTYITFVDAIIYCNRRSAAEGLQPVYEIGEHDNLEGCTSNISTWETLSSSYGLDIGKVGEGLNAKYAFAWDGTKETDYYGGWDSVYDYGHLNVNETANGYRLATMNDMKVIAAWNGNNGVVITSESGMREWLEGFSEGTHNTRVLTEDITQEIESEDYSYLPLSGHEQTDYDGHCGGGTSFTNDISFRVIRYVD